MNALPQFMRVNSHEFKVLKLLGKGKGGYSYLVSKGDKKYVIKQIHHEPCDYYQFGNKLESELRDYHRLKGLGIRVPELIDIDRDRERILKQYIDGDTVYELVLRGSPIVEYLEQIKEMCNLLYSANMNIDYFPTNFVCRSGLMHYVDYECNDYMEQWDFEHWGIRYWAQTPEFLAYADQQGHEVDKANKLW